MQLDVGHPILLEPGGGEVVGDSAERRVEILCDRDELHATWTRFGPYRDGASPHVHRTHCDLFFVLAGELTFLVGPEREERVLLRRHARARAATRRPRLPERERRRAALSQLPRPGGGFADYLRGVTAGFDSEDPPADGGRPAAEAVVVPPGTGGVLVERDEIRIEVRDEPGPASNRLTCLYALEDGRLLQIQA